MEVNAIVDKVETCHKWEARSIYKKNTCQELDVTENSKLEVSFTRL
jgi:hypothetical protein